MPHDFAHFLCKSYLHTNAYTYSESIQMVQGHFTLFCLTRSLFFRPRRLLSPAELFWSGRVRGLTFFSPPPFLQVFVRVLHVVVVAVVAVVAVVRLNLRRQKRKPNQVQKSIPLVPVLGCRKKAFLSPFFALSCRQWIKKPKNHARQRRYFPGTREHDHDFFLVQIFRSPLV